MYCRRLLIFPVVTLRLLREKIKDQAEKLGEVAAGVLYYFARGGAALAANKINAMDSLASPAAPTDSPPFLFTWCMAQFSCFIRQLSLLPAHTFDLAWVYRCRSLMMLCLSHGLIGYFVGFVLVSSTAG